MFRTVRPTGSWFNNHLLFVLGKLTDCRPLQGVDLTRVTNEVLKLAGISSKHPPWKTNGKKALSPARLVGFSHRNLREAYKPNGWLTVLKEDGTWALSWLGAKRARELQGTHLPKWRPKTVQDRKKASGAKIEVIDASQGETLTAQWLREQEPALSEKLIKYLGGRYVTSREHNLLEEHIQTFYKNLIERDSLRSRLEEGQNIPFSKICVYARNSTNSQIRDNARRPLHRIMQGARTKKEREAYMSLEDWSRRIHVKQSDPWSQWTWNEDDESWVKSLEEMPDPSAETTIEEKIGFEQGFAAFLAALKKRAPSQANEYLSILQDRFVMEMSIKECAEKRGISRNQAATMIRSARKIVIREFEHGSLAQDLGLS